MSRAYFLRGDQMQRNRLLVIIVVFLAVLIPASVATWKTYIRIAPGSATDAYIRAIVTGDKAGALKVSSGSAAFNAQKATSGAGVVKLDVEVTDVGPGWAEALAYTELTLQDGSHDAGWYQVTLIQQSSAWKAISLAEAQPWASGLWGFNSKQDVDVVSSVFTSYLQLLTQNRYQDAAKLLAGDARVAQESDAPALGKAPLFKYAGSVHLTPLWRRNDQMVCRADYRIDGRAITAIVRFIRLGDGWHILSLDQV
jgi:hypothetical protein